MTRVGAGASAALSLTLAVLAMSFAPAPALALNDVVGWGANAAGELGNGHSAQANTPVYVCAVNGCGSGRLENVLAVSAGGEHSLALLSDHQVAAWGSDAEGALGGGRPSAALAEEDVPHLVCAPVAAPQETAVGCNGKYLEHVAAIAAGDHDSNVALLENGEVVTWGSNKAGQLGAGYLNSTKFSDAPMYVCGVELYSASCTHLKGISSISAAPAHDAAIMSGELLTWGVNEVGQLGQGDYSPYSDAPAHVCEVEYEPIAWSEPVNTPSICRAGNWLVGVESITFGLEHNIATFSGPYLARHWSEQQEVRVEEEEDAYTKDEKGGKKGEKPHGYDGKPETFKAEAEHSVVAFGNNEEGQLGTGVSVRPYYAVGHAGPQKCNLGRPCAQVPMHVCRAEFAPLGHQRCYGPHEYLEPVQSISAGGAHSLAREQHGEVLAWGQNELLSSGEFGLVGDRSDPHETCSFAARGCSPVPWHTCTLSCGSATEHLSGIREISGGDLDDLALTEGEEVLSWGSNAEGQLGHPAATHAEVPVQVCEAEQIASLCPGHNLREITQISAGLTHNLAVANCHFLIWFPFGPQLPFADTQLDYRYIFRVTCLSEGPVHWKVIGGETPGGTSLNAETGVLEGRPAQPGSSSFTVEASDGAKESATATVSVDVLSPPDIGRCEKVSAEPAGYTFTDKGCSDVAEGASGKYEWLPGVEKAGFSLSGKGTATLQTVSGTTLTCSAASGSGQFTAGGVQASSLRLTGCQSQGQTCTSPEAGEGTLQSGQLEGSLGWESRDKRRVALDLYPAARIGPLLQFSCGTGPLETVTGSVIVPVKAGKPDATMTLKFSGSKGRQKPEAFEGAEKDVLISALGEEAGQQTSLTMTAEQSAEEAIEINAAT